MKVDSVPTLTPNTLGDHIFKTTGWQSIQNIAVNNFHINRLEDVREALKFPTAPHRKTVIDFILVTHGSMIRRLGLDRYEVPANTFVFLAAHQISLDEWMSDDIRGYYCHFDISLLTKYWQKQDLEQDFPFLKFLGNPLVTVDNEVFANVLPLVKRLEVEFRKSRAESTDLFRLYLLTLFTELKASLQLASDGKTSLPENIPPGRLDNAALRITQLYKKALTQQIHEKQSVAEYAELLHISPNHLNKCVKKATGKSARNLLDDILLLEVKVLLARTDLSISEIAYRFGIEVPGNFARFFRAKTGKTPTEYRLMD
ncbi:helix-turn-helix domain-containing protein [Fibrella forsythiae]|uniref:AraC family transcriptional regulator n=1 Tax=Fibrella forsythiae TaxID=2817061 RepID=A0ABS3JPJ3_9BACT|nr:AraC family transcriptional regulator [Fibrella forsythiae]MBO0951912.1 AraC family transcriptional regulator [Fibrella forsythiae]